MERLFEISKSAIDFTLRISKEKMKRLFYQIIVFSSLLFTGCAPMLGTIFPFDFTNFRDEQIPDDVAVYLEDGEQSAITPRIAKEAKRISGKNRRERLYRAMLYIWKTFSYDRWLNTESFRRTADELFESGILGGCSDFALVEIALFRAVGIPSRIVITANVDWIYQYHHDELAMSEGHSFIEVFLEDRWYLVDSTYRWFFSDYDPSSPSYPHGEFFCKRGKDFWDMGIKDVDDLDRILRELALNYKGEFMESSYPRHPI